MAVEDTTHGGVANALREAIQRSIPGSEATVTASGGGHFSLEVRAAAFEGHTMLESHRMVMASIAHLMKGDQAPVHAIDTLKTRKA